MRNVAKFPPELGIEEFETVMVNQYGEIIQHMKCRCKTYLEDLGGGMSLELVEVPGEAFMMGPGGFGGYEDEKPSHWVQVPAFLLGKYQVTQQQWDLVTRKEKPYRIQGPRRPADRISWLDAAAFSKILS